MRSSGHVSCQVYIKVVCSVIIRTSRRPANCYYKLKKAPGFLVHIFFYQSLRWIIPGKRRVVWFCRIVAHYRRRRTRWTMPTLQLNSPWRLVIHDRNPIAYDSIIFIFHWNRISMWLQFMLRFLRSVGGKLLS